MQQCDAEVHAVRSKRPVHVRSVAVSADDDGTEDRRDARATLARSDDVVDRRHIDGRRRAAHVAVDDHHHLRCVVRRARPRAARAVLALHATLVEGASGGVDDEWRRRRWWWCTHAVNAVWRWRYQSTRSIDANTT